MTDKRRRTIIMVLCFAMAALTLMGYFISEREEYSGQSEAKDYILAHHVEETGALNSVTAIYLNYRLWDTLFEAMVLMLSALAVITFSWSEKDE
ncbi:MAG: hypothetical protein JXN65_11350 [Clostridia bacterium]|nr:hypothetical protein [Clostridia bacterium]